jgi:lysylphosphatidylglycerol synthetase-like protein (DUF2156 family)
VATAVVLTTLLAAGVEVKWPDDASRTVGYPRWLLWAALLSAAHLAGGLAGGGVAAALDRLRPRSSVAWVGALVFILLSVPAVGAFDRPVELASMIFLNLVTLVGVVGGGAFVVARLRRNGDLTQ